MRDPLQEPFCRLEGLSKFFVLKDKGKDIFSLQLMFAEGDVCPMGESKFSDRQYSNALDWTITANKKIALKQRNEKKGHPSDLAKTQPWKSYQGLQA